jgi:hypothetical protein
MMQMTHSIELPSWMIPIEQAPQLPKEDQGKSYAQIRKESQEKRFEVFFSTILDKLEMGIALTEILRDDQRNYDYQGILRWIHKDPQRLAKYREAQMIGTEMVMAECVEIADGKDGIEDVQRSKLRIDTRLFQAKSWNRQRYGDIKTVEVNQSISIRAAIEDGLNRLPTTNRVIDHEDIE